MWVGLRKIPKIKNVELGKNTKSNQTTKNQQIKNVVLKKNAKQNEVK